MGRGLSLRAYLAYAGGRPARPDGDGNAPADPDMQRPPGQLVWLHADDPAQARAVAALSSRLANLRPDLAIVQTGHGEPPPGILSDALPGETSTEAAAFAEFWQPDIGILAGQSLRPALLSALHDSGTRLTLLGAADAPFVTPGPRWLPDPGPHILALFDCIYAEDAAAQRRLRRLGIAGDIIRVVGPLLETGTPLDANDAAVDKATAQLASRPMWLAARLRADEIDTVLHAHRQAMRLAHRLVLIVVPHCEDDAETVRQAARRSGLRRCDWDQGEVPDEHTQLLLTGSPDELGLWYRVAPLAFLGGSLVAGPGGTPPLEAAALGTAILYGPNVGRHLPTYSRLAEAGAARIVRDADSLGTAVSHLIAPDRAALMAHAGWDVTTAGADLIDTVCDEVCTVLDEREGAA